MIMLELSEESVAMHLNPVWRDRADFVIHAAIEDAKEGRQWEQLWVRQLAADHFEICCIPFFAYDLALGDEVQTKPSGTLAYLIDRVTKKSGRSTFRVWFGAPIGAKDSAKDRIVEDIARMGLLCEWYSTNLLGIDAPTEAMGQHIANYLVEKQRNGILLYETGRTR